MDNLPQLQDIKSLKRVVIKDFNFEAVEVQEEEFQRKPEDIKNGQFVAKVYAAPINPLDLLKIQGRITGLATPFTPGSEGSGVIIYPNELRGKKVAFYTVQGSFRQYIVEDMNNATILDDDTDLQVAACATVNPFTAIGLVDTAVQNQAQAIINTAANSQLGIMVHKIALKQNIEVINLVRTPERVEEFKNKYNAKHVLDIQSPSFEQELKELAGQLQATVCFDAYGGDVSGGIFNSLPKGGKQFCYGSLISPFINKVSAVDMRWGGKTYTGFLMSTWLSNQSQAQKEKARDIIRQGLKDSFQTVILQEYAIENFADALKGYIKNMSGGKHIIRM